MHPEDQYFDEYDELEEPEDEEVTEDTDEASLNRVDKIFNNRYNTGEGLIECEEFEYTRKISVSSEYSNEFLKDVYDYEEALNTKLILNTIFSFIQSDPEIKKMLESKATAPFSTRLKLSKDEVNFLFNRINDSLNTKDKASLFYSPIYALEVISSISSIEYKKLFDMMETEIQEILLIELNTKYQILEGKMHKKRIH